MRKIFILLAVFFLGFGIVATVTDYKETTGQARTIKNYPVISASEVDKYIAKDAKKFVVTDITISGTKVSDPKGLLDGEYFYILALAEEYNLTYEREVEWYDKHEADYEIQATDLVTNVNPNQAFKGDQVFYCPVINSLYDNGVNKNDLHEGDLCYTFRGIGEGDTLTALMTVGDGKAILETLLERDEEYYLVGDEHTYYEHVDDFLVGDSFTFLILGVILAALLGFLAHLWRGKSPVKRAGEQIKEINTARKSRNQQYQELASPLKKRYWKLRIIGSLLAIAGLALIVVGYESTGLIVVGTILLIIGIAAFNSALPQSYNEGSDMIHMMTMDRVRTIEEFYEAYKNVNTPFGSAYLGTFYTMSHKALIWGPDSEGQFLYFWLNKDGLIGYVGYSFMKGAIKKKLTEPMILPRKDFATSTADYICYNSDVILLQQNLFDSLEHFATTGEILPIRESVSSEVYAFDEAFKLTGQHFTLCDLAGRVLYEVDGTMPLVTFTIYDVVGNEIFKVKKEIGHALTTYNFYYYGQPYGTLEKQFCLVKDKFTMQLTEGKLELTEFAGYLGHNFNVTLNGRSIGAIMDNLEFNLNNIVFDNSVVIAYESNYLPLLTAMAIMVAREIARDHSD